MKHIQTTTVAAIGVHEDFEVHEDSSNILTGGFPRQDSSQSHCLRTNTMSLQKSPELPVSKTLIIIF